MNEKEQRDAFLKSVLARTGEKGTVVKLYMQSMQESTAWLESKAKS